MTQPEALREALAELVALKDLKAKWLASRHESHIPTATWNEWRAEYERRKPAAWERARAALEAHGAREPVGEVVWRNHCKDIEASALVHDLQAAIGAEPPALTHSDLLDLAEGYVPKGLVERCRRALAAAPAERE